MRDLLVLVLHLIVTVIRLAKPGGVGTVVAESVLIRHQLLILNRGRKRAPNLRAWGRILAGLCSLFIRRARILRSAIVLKPSTLIVTKISGQPEITYKAGHMFYEPPGSTHEVSRNASQTEPAKLPAMGALNVNLFVRPASYVIVC